MIKLALPLLLLSTSVLAEDIDLKKDAMYYCINDSLTGIKEGKASTFSPESLGKLTLKVKGGNLIFKGKSLELNSTHEGEFNLKNDWISLATLNGLLFIDYTNNIITYTASFSHLPVGKKVEMYAMQGTCTKW